LLRLRRDHGRRGADGLQARFGDAQERAFAVQLPAQAGLLVLAGVLVLSAPGAGEEPGGEQGLGHRAAWRRRQVRRRCGEAVRVRRGGA
jgi:hypothetical protein